MISISSMMTNTSNINDDDIDLYIDDIKKDFDCVAITFLPDSPSSCSFCNLGITTVKSWRIILEVIYGIIPRANTEKVSKAPPENKLRRP